MMPRSIRGRIRLWFVATTALVLAGFSVVLSLRTEAAGLARIDHQLFERALAIAAACEWEDGRLQCEARAMLHQYDQAQPLQAFVVTSWPDGSSVYRSPSSHAAAFAPFSGDVVAALTPGAHVRRDSVPAIGAELRHCVLLHALPDHDEERPTQPHVLVETVQSLAPFQAEIRAFGWRLLLIGSLALACAALAGGYLATKIVDPLARIAAATSLVEARGEGLIAAPNTGDEIEVMVDSLNRAFERMREAYRRQTRFAADASHELRTPLAVILTAGEVALRRPREPQEYREALEQITQAARRSDETLSGLLLLARAEAGRLESRSESLQLKTILAAVIEGRENIVCSFSGDTRIRGDARLLSILCENLVANAVRYGSPDSRVEVRVIAAGSQVRLEVEDHGIGIAADKLQQVFEPFYRTDEARSRAAGGSGLGLAMARAIADVHGAHCTIQSTLGAGTCVIVDFPGEFPGEAASAADQPA